jgi:hypothetical protein
VASRPPSWPSLKRRHTQLSWLGALLGVYGIFNHANLHFKPGTETINVRGRGDCSQRAEETKSSPLIGIIPRNIFFDTLLSLQPLGRETPLRYLLWGGSSLSIAV